MRILWLSAGLLLPLDKGGKLRTWHLMRHLARRHEIEFLGFADPDQPAADMKGMHEVCSALHVVRRRTAQKGTLSFVADATAHVLRRDPYAVGAYRSAEYQAKIRALVNRGGFDLVLSDFLPPMVNLPEVMPLPLVLFTHNVESEIWRRHAETATGPRRLLLASQWRRMLRFERHAVSRADLVLAVSDADRRTLRDLYGPLRQPVHVVPTGVDTAYFAPRQVDVRPRHLVFTGSMDGLPNEDAMLFFVREVLPRIRQVEPETTLSIVGRRPTPAVTRLASEAIEVTGDVEDVRPYVAEAAVYVVPLRVGGGTRLKIFEAMAMGKAIVSTAVGAEGLPVSAGLHLLLADEPEAFARGVVRLLQNRTERARLGDAARHLVVEQYDWSAVIGHLEHALLAAAGRGSGAETVAADVLPLELTPGDSR
jgi:sugar transferase (PEP-CTERM/EpsH1 system associated)